MVTPLDGRTIAQVERALGRDRETLPLCEAVNRRVGAASWVLRLDAAGRLTGITVLGTTTHPPAEEPAQDPPPAASALPPLDRLYPLPAGGVLARLLGVEAATGRQLADLALRQDDPAVRGEAVRAGVDAMMRDPGLERMALGALDGIDDGALADLIASAGEGVAGLVSLVAERSRGRPLGRRAAALLARLPAR